jgi:uncharacterized membrane protein YkvA (DUF1232 family)
MPTSHHRIFDQLQQLNCGELKSSAKLVSLLQAKINILDTSQFDQSECAPIARLFAEILKEVLADRYQTLSIRAFAHLAVALDYFLDPLEETPDAHTGGFLDDLQFLRSTERRFAQEIQSFKIWRARQPS